MRVSVVVPLYNKERTVLRTLAAIAAQDCADFEAIIVDDGSTDGGDAVAEAFPDPRFRLIRQENAGPGAARNTGIAAARADLIAFLDADDVWSADYLSTAVAALSAHPEAASVTVGYREMPGGSSTEPMWRRRGLSAGQFALTPGTSAQLAASVLAYMSPCTTVFRTDVVRRHGGFYSRDRCLYGEDAHLCLKILLNHPVLLDLEPRVTIHRDASGLSANLPAARPIEPFLLNADEIRAASPPALAPLLERLLALRAFKTSCVLGYWGEWRRARDLRRRFSGAHARGLPYRFASLACATPLATPLGAAARAFRRG